MKPAIGQADGSDPFTIVMRRSSGMVVSVRAAAAVESMVASMVTPALFFILE